MIEEQHSIENYSQIIRILAEFDVNVSHSSIHNYYTRGLRKVAKSIYKTYGFDLSDDQINEIIKTPAFVQLCQELFEMMDVMNEEDD